MGHRIDDSLKSIKIQYENIQGIASKSLPIF